MEGAVKFYDAYKGYGFITSDEDGKDYFFHASNVFNQEVVNDSDRVTFKLIDGRKGKQADDVRLIKGGF